VEICTKEVGGYYFDVVVATAKAGLRKLVLVRRSRGGKL